MCFAIRGLPAVIDTSLPHGYKKSEPYKASYSPDWNGCGQKATAVRPRLCIPVSVMVLISATANPGSSACCAAVLQGITRRLAPTGGVLGCRPWNHCPKKALTPPGSRPFAAGQLMSSTGRQVTGSFRWHPVSSVARSRTGAPHSSTRSQSSGWSAACCPKSAIPATPRRSWLRKAAATRPAKCAGIP